MLIKEYRTYNEKEIIDLYNSVGFTAYTKKPEILKSAYQNSLLVLGAYKNDKLAGIIRVVGDGTSIIFIQDLLVSPNYQRQGIGSSLMKEVLNRYTNVRQIELLTDKDDEVAKAFYKSLGFREFDDFNCLGFARFK